MLHGVCSADLGRGPPTRVGHGERVREALRSQRCGESSCAGRDGRLTREHLHVAGSGRRGTGDHERAEVQAELWKRDRLTS